MSLLLSSNQDWIEWQDAPYFRVNLGSVFSLIVQVERGCFFSCKVHTRLFYKLHNLFSHNLHISVAASSYLPIPPATLRLFDLFR